MFAALRGRDHRFLYLRKLRRARPALRRRGIRLSKSRCSAQSDPRFQIRPAASSASSRGPLAERNADRRTARQSALRSHRAGAITSGAAARTRIQPGGVARPRSCTGSAVFLSARCCSARATPRRRRSSIAASGWKICGVRFVYGAAATCKVCGCCWSTMSSPPVRL